MRALSGATRQLSQRESPWHVGQLSSGRAKHDVSGTVVRCCQDSRQLDKVRCPEAAGPVSKARPFTPYRASGVQLRVARPAKASPFGRGVTEGDGEGKPGTKEPLRSDGQVSLRTTSPSSLRDATSPSRGGFGSPRKVNGFARGSPTRGAVERSETERLYEGQPDHGRKAQFFALPTCKKAVIRVE